MCCNSLTWVPDHAQIRPEGRPFKVRDSMCVVLLLLKKPGSGTLTSDNGENENIFNGFDLKKVTKSFVVKSLPTSLKT